MSIYRTGGRSVCAAVRDAEAPLPLTEHDASRDRMKEK